MLLSVESITWQNSNPTNNCEFGQCWGGEESSGVGWLVARNIHSDKSERALENKFWFWARRKTWNVDLFKWRKEKQKTKTGRDTLLWKTCIFYCLWTLILWKCSKVLARVILKKKLTVADRIAFKNIYVHLVTFHSAMMY